MQTQTPTTQVIKVDAKSPDKKLIRYAAAILRDGGLVAFPTETVYGIGVNCRDKKAINKLYEVKKRPKSKPLTLHISKVSDIRKMKCDITLFARELIKKFWPGPLTIIFKCGNKKCGLRMPANPVAQALIDESKVPVAAPSANISGKNPPKDARDIARELTRQIDLVLDGGKTEFERESTIVDTTVFPYKILRKGAVSKTEIEKIWKQIA